MKAAAAARDWWAACRQRLRGPSGIDPRGGKITRLSLCVLLILAAAVMTCAVIGAVLTGRDDRRIETEQYAALHLALDEVHAVFGDVDHLDAPQLILIERRTGLKDLRFDAEPKKTAGRDVQSLHDAAGRIVGWLSWTSGRELLHTLDLIWGVIGMLAGLIALYAVFALLATRRLVRSLASSIEINRKLGSEDALTGLPNHRVMLARLDDALARRRAGIVAFALIDLDGFREVNDTLGRSGGDTMITIIVERFRSGLPPGVVFGRFEDDEFAVILESDDTAAATALGGVLRAVLARPIFMEQTWQISAAVGIAQSPDDGATGAELARRAGLALRAAKRRGRGAVQSFRPKIETDHTERRFMLRELELAIFSGGLDVHYQPIVAADGGAIIGVEALLRWSHQTHGAIAPSVFIPLAEQSGLMLQLGEFVLRRALADAARWPELSVAVNLSPVQLRDPGLLDLVRATIEASAIAPSRVVLEVTEGVLIDEPQETQSRLEALRALGVSIALDDFGTGYSSLSYLQTFRFDLLKIDRSFVASLGAKGNAAAIIQSIVTLGHALGVAVLAEGVETDEQRVLLRLAGCDEMQGYLFARPGPAEAIDRQLAERPAARAAAGRPARSLVGS